MSQFDQVSVIKQANVFFDGKCVSHTVILADGVRKSVGVILPSTLTFNVGVPEIMEIIAGSCSVRIAEGTAQTYQAGEQFSVPANSTFEITASAPVHYVCHFG